MDILGLIGEFYDSFKGEKGYMGFSELKNPITFFKVKKSESPVLLFTYGIHAREYITSYLSLLQIEDFIRRGNRGTVYFIPALNPDGIKICLSGKPLYKANARRVDLNVNFDARWGKGKSNLDYPADENYIGRFPFSETETKSLRDFTLKIMPDMTVSYHSKGEEIYYEFFQDEKTKERDYEIAMAVSLSTGYPVKSTVGSVGGYKDWCIEKLKIPSLTIEVGSDKLSHPIDAFYADGIFEKNKEVVKILTEEFF